MKEAAAWVCIFSLLVGAIYGIFKLEQYKFRDCKKVGHTTLYCVLNMGK